MEETICGYYHNVSFLQLERGGECRGRTIKKQMKYLNNQTDLNNLFANEEMRKIFCKIPPLLPTCAAHTSPSASLVGLRGAEAGGSSAELVRAVKVVSQRLGLGHEKISTSHHQEAGVSQVGRVEGASEAVQGQHTSCAAA